MANLRTIALVLILLWVVASVTKFVVGAALHLLLIVGLVLLVVSAVKRFRS
jgi:Family of unknown function (DUF5670)